jgi:sugar phosphate permease
VANWFPIEKRGKMSGILGSSYQIGNAYSWALAGTVVGFFGWRWAFFIPGGLLVLSVIHWLIRGRNAPEEVGLPTIEEEDRQELKEFAHRKDHHLGFDYTLALVLKSKRIWSAALALFCLNIIRYGFMNWAPTFMFEVQKAHISTAAFKAMLLPLAGSLGAAFAGYSSDKFFQHRRAPMATIMLVLLGLFAWFYPRIPSGNWVLSLFCLMLIGFMTYGPHVIIVATMPMDFGTRKASASAAGFIDCFGYIGASLTGIGSGWLIDNFGWPAAFYLWVMSAFVTAGLVGINWMYKPEKGMYH